MKINEKQLASMKERLNVDEILHQANEAGVELSAQDAQKMIDSFSMIEIDEDSLDIVAGGEFAPDQYAASWGVPCTACGDTYTMAVVNEWWSRRMWRWCFHCRDYYTINY